MVRALFGIDSSKEIASFDIDFNGGWITAVLLTAAAIALAVYLYRSETRITQNRRIIMGVCKGLALLVLVLIILEPVAVVRLIEPYKRTMLVLFDVSESMSIQDQRTTADDITEAATVMGKVQLGKAVPPDAVDAMRQEIGPVSRLDLARAAVQHEDIDLINKLSEKYQVRTFSFADRLTPEGGASDSGELLKDRVADGETSKIGTAMEEAVVRYSGREVAGVVVLSDFAKVKGRDPVQVAKELKGLKVPVYAVAVGLPQPPDIKLPRVIVPEVVFKGDRVPIRIQLESYGFDGNTVELVLAVDGEQAMSKQIELSDGIQFEEMMFIPERQSGTVKLDLSIDPLPGETSTENNSLSRDVQIIDEKIKVLYIEGMPRWEYRYLRWVLLRDPRLEVTFLMTQGDPSLAATSPRHIARFPQVAKDAFKYDLIILGDVHSSYFNTTQIELIEDLVKTRGGSLLMIAGPMAAPASYRDSPIAGILPVNLGNGQWCALGDAPVVTAAGRESSVTTLSMSPDANARIWSQVRPMYVPDLEGAKPGATVLLSKPKESEQIRDYPLVAWHRFGNGKSMFVGTEDLWRMKREVGDRYHARFWGQAIQFLTLSRLLGKNKQITLETDRRTYGSGDQIHVYANVLTQTFDPVVQPNYKVILNRTDTTDAAATVTLNPEANSEGLYSTVQLAGEPGTYELVTAESADEEVSNRVVFKVESIPLEKRETAMQANVVRQVAEQSGGRTLGLLDLAKLPAELGEEEELSKIVRLQMDLWDKPILFGLLVLFCGVEWYMRRRDNLV